MVKSKAMILEQLYCQYWPLMYHVAVDILKDSNLAEDAVQGAFLKLTKNNFQIDEIKCNKTKAFMVIVVRSAAFDIYQIVNKRGEINFEDGIPEAIDSCLTPLELIVDNESIANIRENLKTINPTYAEIVTLKYLYDYSNKRIADILHISEKNVYVRLHRARKMLAAKLIKGGASHE